MLLKERIYGTVLVILVPIMAMALIGGLFQWDGLGQPWDFLLLIVVWIIGLAWVWLRPRRQHGH